MQPNYNPYSERSPDSQYTELLKLILEKGRPMHTPFHQGIGARQYLGARLEYDFKNGFPLLPHRSVKGAFAPSLGEIIAFMNGARTQEELVKYGCTWWADWLTAEKCAAFGLSEGDSGPGAYGPRLKPQIEPLLAQMRDFPTARTHLLTTWDPQYTLGTKANPRKVVVAPCHGTVVHFQLNPDAKELELVHLQRSGDVPVGVIFNLVHYAALGMMVAQVLGYRMRRLVHLISDAHIYDNQVPFVAEVLGRELRPFPTVTLDESVKDIFAFRPEHFKLEDYNPHPALRIPTPV